MTDPRATEARHHHDAARQALADAGQHRQQRDQLVRALRADDPDVWTHRALAAAVGCSPELIAKIFKPQTR